MRSSELLRITFSGSRNVGSFEKIVLYLVTICSESVSMVALMLL